MPKLPQLEDFARHSPGTVGTGFPGAPDTIRTCVFCRRRPEVDHLVISFSVGQARARAMRPARTCIVTPINHPKPKISVDTARGSPSRTMLQTDMNAARAAKNVPAALSRSTHFILGLDSSGAALVRAA